VTVAHFVDESFDKLMSIIENGEASFDIDIRIRDAETTEALEVGGNDIQVLFGNGCKSSERGRAARWRLITFIHSFIVLKISREFCNICKIAGVKFAFETLE